MKKLTVNGHIANDTKGTLFFTDGTAITMDREIWQQIMDALLKDKKIQVAENITLYF